MQLHIAHAVINISHTSALPFDLSDLDTSLPTGTEIVTAAPAAATPALTPPAYGEIWPGQGGIYVGTMPAMHGTPARHLIASVDQVESMKWALEYIDQPGARSHWNGPANCQALLDSKQEHPAAQWCHNYEEGGFTDWHLPSRADLLMAYMCAPERFERSSYYWTSTQNGRSDAFVQVFEDGYSGWLSKDFEFRVRAFRWILT